MTTVLIIHSALGLRPAVLELADAITAMGHTAVAPDFFAGAVFEGGEAGYAAAMAHLKESGEAAGARVRAAYAGLPGPVVVLGFSWGSGAAQRLAEREGRVVGALLVAGGERYSGEWDDGGRWRPGIPLACHAMIDDPWLDAEPHAALVAEAARAGSDVSDYVYPGAGHLFMDPGLTEEFDAVATELLHARVGGFLSRFPEG
jgi:dienelactone hydrolase